VDEITIREKGALKKENERQVLLPLRWLHSAFPFQPSFCFYITAHSLPAVQARSCSGLEFGHGDGAAFLRCQMRRRKLEASAGHRKICCFCGEGAGVCRKL
jgi:hypothetical protein